MQLFYCPDIVKGVRILPADEALHCIKVLRKTEGDEIDITDGLGGFYKARLTNSTVKNCAFTILSTSQTVKPDYSIHIALSPTKSPERMEWFVEKVVEIGIDSISFFQSEHSERSHLNLDRLRKKAISAMKQSERAFLPVIHEMKKFEDIIQNTDSSNKYIAHRENNSTLQLLNAAGKNGHFTILIGPEGGFSAGEIREATDVGFVPVLLGNHRLRTETAGVVACTILSMVNQA
jgi:16S rRNA (uracil1498-N3)-methyltransferase